MKTIEQTYTINAPLANVWEALTDSDIAEKWGAGPAKVKAVEGGIFSYWDGDIHGTFTKIIPHKRIEQEWYGHDNPTWKYTVVFLFEAIAKDETQLTYIYSGNIVDETRDRADWYEYYFGPITRLLEE